MILSPQVQVQKLPDRIHRELRKGETIYFSSLPCHVSKKFPEGKWISQCRREDSRGNYTKFPVKGFGTPKEALEYLISLRPDNFGRVMAARSGEPTVAALYEYVVVHRQKRLSDRTKKDKAARWRLHIEPAWGDCPVSQVTRRKAQEWISELEDQIEEGKSGTLGLAQLQKCRTDLHYMFECAGSFDAAYEDRKNPFAGLDFSQIEPRTMVTIESTYFPAVAHACNFFANENLCTFWIAEMFQTSLLGGLRAGEVMALCQEQIDFENGVIVIDRAFRRNSRALDPKTMKEVGPVLPQVIGYPKCAKATVSKTRIVPMSDQLAKVLRAAIDRRGERKGGEWNLVWPSRTGKLKELTRFRTAWVSLRDRLNETATFAAIGQTGFWAEVPGGRGRKRNALIDIARADEKFRLPALFSDIDYRDTRNSFSSFANEVGISQATREKIMGHSKGITNRTYTAITSPAIQDAQRKLSNGWKELEPLPHEQKKVAA